MLISKQKSRKHYHVIIAVVACLAAVLIFGIRTNQSGREEIRSLIVKSLDLSGEYSISQTAPHLLRGLLSLKNPATPAAELETIYVHIKQKHLEKVKEERLAAQRIGKLVAPGDFKAIVEYHGTPYQVKMHLKGNLSDHWTGKDRWSFMIAVRGGKRILGFRRFAIQKPSTRQFPFDYIFQDIIRQQGGLSSAHKYVRVYVNGDYWGVMDAEERVGDEFLERHKRKAGIIIRLTDQEGKMLITQKQQLGLKTFDYLNYNFDLFRERKKSLSRTAMLHYSYVVQSLRKVNERVMAPSKVLSYPQLSRTMATTLAWGNSHTLDITNSRYYLNPYTLKLEPITTDAAPPAKLLESTAQSILDFSSFPYSTALQDRQYLTKLESNLQNQKEGIPSINASLSYLQSVFPIEKELIAKSVADTDKITMHNAESLGRRLDRSELANISQTPPEPVLPKSFVQSDLPDSTVIWPDQFAFFEYYNDGELNIYSRLPYPLILTSIRHSLNGKKGQELLTEPIEIVARKRGVLAAPHPIQLPRLPVDRNNPIEISMVSLGHVRTMQVVKRLYKNTYNPFNSIPAASTSDFPFMEISGRSMVIRSGTHHVNAPIRIPKGHTLTIEDGTTLLFAPEAYILSQGPIRAKGSLGITLSPANGVSWKGVYVSEAQGTSLLQHTRIIKTTALEDSALILTGAVTFHKSPVTIENTRFEGTEAEDALNIVQSDFKIRNVTFTDTRSDALDLDFCTGTIQGASFSNSGGDGLDTSGSRVQASKLSFSTIKDKAISGGEQSDLSITNVHVVNTGTGVVSKDGSKVDINNIKTHNIHHYHAMSYTKKGFYGPASLAIHEETLQPKHVVVQKENELILNGTSIPGTEMDVDALYKIGHMKKQ